MCTPLFKNYKSNDLEESHNDPPKNAHYMPIFAVTVNV